MIAGKRVLAVVPARSGSKGIPDKNLQTIAGRSLIGWAAVTIQGAATVDQAVLSTDSERYMADAAAYGLAAPFRRPPELSTDTAGAVDTMLHAVSETERVTGERFDVCLIVEPTCPLRRSEDLDRSVTLLAETGADSVVTVSRADSKYHPRKLLTIREDRLDFYDPAGAAVVARQSLEPVYYRNGACYALTRECLFARRAIFTGRTRPLLIERPLVNIDDPLELEFARYLLERRPG